MTNIHQVKTIYTSSGQAFISYFQIQQTVWKRAKLNNYHELIIYKILFIKE